MTHQARPNAGFAHLHTPAHSLHRHLSFLPPTPQVPKAFKVIPNLQNWEEILYLTEPESWTPHAVYQVGGRVRLVGCGGLWWRVGQQLGCCT